MYLNQHTTLFCINSGPLSNNYEGGFWNSMHHLAASTYYITEVHVTAIVDHVHCEVETDQPSGISHSESTPVYLLELELHVCNYM